MMILKDILIKLLLVFIIFWFPLNVSAQGNNTSQDIINNLEVKEFNSASSTEKPEDEFKCTNDFVIKVNPNKKMSIVSPNLFGVNATTYTGNYLTDSTFISHAKKLQPALVRFPGGDASNMYFFNGLPSDLPDKALTFNGEWTDFADGMKDINWKMNTEKYYAFLDSTGAKGFITVNYAYARYGTGSNPVEKAASLAADWVRYDKGRTNYWEVGNETYACWEGGFRIDTSLNNDKQPEYINGQLYGEHFRIFADSMRAAAKQAGTEIYIGAVFADDDYIWDGSGKDITKNWNKLLAPELRKDDGSNYADFISVHSYFLNKGEKTPAAIINSFHVTDELQEYIYSKLDEANVAHVPLALTEWNVKSPYQSTQVGALQAVAAICRMQEIGFGAACYFALKDYWRDDEGDFGMFSHHDPFMKQSEPYPAFYHMFFLKQTLGNHMVETKIHPPNDSLIAFASSFTGGGTRIILINKSCSEQSVNIDVSGIELSGTFYWYEVSKYNDGNIWSEKIEINGISNPEAKKGGPSANYHKIPAWKKQCKEGIKIIVNGISAIYIFIE